MWVRLAKEEIERTPPDVSIFISDLRFLNEMQMLEEMGFKTVRVIRDEAQNASVGAGTHSSETALTGVSLRDWGSIIYNDGTIDDFHFKLKQMALKLEQETPISQEDDQQRYKPVLTCNEDLDEYYQNGS